MSSNSTSTQIFSIALPVICTLLGVLVTSWLGWFNSNQSAILAAKQACIIRVDSQEKEIRLKAGNFLSAYGDIASYLTVADRLTSAGMQKATSPLFRAGFEMIAFSPTVLANSTAMLMNALRDTIIDNIQGNQSKEHDENTAVLFGRWTENYGAYLVSLSQQRETCR
ncbi:hypothetical protein L8S97_10400 [Enterobacter cloacae]|uniref:hypothetical protein n=1 Tax=Enterobacter cloacae TaxID=550 RepID=UPI002002AFB3|nr:hypothetical protein [Enterobacter cloacae]MCK6711054.1 hypothetical protein [Enterobacter cloacae]